jgi:VCBS repeat-containing protein/YVTN family beta-propeller protein
VDDSVTVVGLGDGTVTTIEGISHQSKVVVSPDGTRAYVVSNIPGSVKVIDTATNSVVDTFFTQAPGARSFITGIALTADGSRLYASDGITNDVAVIRTSDGAVIDTFGGFVSANDISLSPDGSVLYVANDDPGFNENSVTAVDTATHAVLRVFRFIDNPGALAATSDGSRVYVSRLNGGTVSVLSFAQATNHAPASGIPSYGAADPTTGAVIGQLDFTDPDGDPLTYSVASQPTHGTVEFNSDGTFTYTPTPAARHAAAADGAPVSDTTDTFIVGASDGTTTTYGFFQVSVAPANRAPAPVGPISAVPGVNYFASYYTMSADGTRAYVSIADPQTDAETLAMIDTATNAVTFVPLHGQGTVANVPGQHVQTLVSPDGRYVYLARHDATSNTNFLDVVNTTAGTVSVAPLPQAQLYQSPNGQYVYGLDTDSVGILDTTTNTVTTVPLAHSVYNALSVRPDGSGVVVVNASVAIKPLTVINNDGTAQSYAVSGNYASQIAASPDGSHVYLLGGNPLGTGANLTVVDLTSGTSHDVTFADTTRYAPLTISKDGAHVYLVTHGDTLTVLDAAGSTLATAALGGTYNATVLSPDGTHLYALNGMNAADTVSPSMAVVDLATLGVTTVPLTTRSDFVVFSPNGNDVIVGSSFVDDSTVSIVDRATSTVTTTYHVGGYRYGDTLSYLPVGPFQAITNDGRYFSTVVYRDGAFSVVTIDTASSSMTSTPLPDNYEDISGAFTPDGRHFFGGAINPATGRDDAISMPIPPSAEAISGVTLGTSAPGTRAVSGDLHFTDADGDALTYSVQTDPTRGTVTVDQQTGAFTYTPTYSGTATTDTFTLLVNDGHGGRVPVTISVPVSSSNHAPAITVTRIGYDPATDSSTYRVTGTDPDGDTLTYGATAATIKGVVVANDDGTYTYVPGSYARHRASADNATAADGFDTISFSVTDPSGASASASVDIVITPKNTAPAPATSGSSTLASGAYTTGFVHDQDADGDTLTYSGTGDTAKGHVEVNPDGTFTYTPTATARHAAASATAPNDATYDEVSVIVNDGHGGVAVRKVIVPVLPRNAAPTANPTTSAPNSAGVVTGSVNGSDADGDAVTYTLTSGPAKGTATVSSTGAVRYTSTAAAQHAASATNATDADLFDSITVTVSDRFGGSTPVVIRPAILPKNAAPKATGTIASPDASGASSGSIAATDADGDTLAYAVTSGPSKGSVVVNAGGGFTYTPTAAAQHAASATGATAADRRDAFTITVSDGHGGTKAVAFTPTVVAKNAGPTATPTTGAPDSAGVVTGTVGATDTDGDTLAYTVTGKPSKGTVTVDANGGFTYTATAAAQHAASASNATAAQKQDSFKITVSDGHGGTQVVTVTPVVAPRNTDPGALPVINAPTSAGVVTGTVGASDPDGDALTYTVTTGPAKGAVTVATNGAIRYTPTAAAQHAASSVTATAADQTDAFTVTVSDGHGGTRAVTVSAPIAPKNAGPTATSTVNAPDASGTVTGTVTGSDADSDPVTYSVTSGPTKGSVTLNATGGFTYTPTAAARHAAAATGATTADKRDTFTVTVSDGHGGTKAVALTATISPRNTAPTANPQNGTPSAADGAVTGAVRGADADSDTLTYSVTRSTTKGTLTFNADGTYTYTPTAAARQKASKPNATAADKQDTFVVSIKDGYGGTTVLTVTVPVA